MHLLTPKGISEKLILTLHFLKRKEKEYELLKEEIAHLHEELATSPLAANPLAQDVIERIEEAKHFVMRKHANEMDPNLITKLKIAWRN
jgi:hypothetical protein